MAIHVVNFEVEPWKVFPFRMAPAHKVFAAFPKLSQQGFDDIINYIYNNFEEVQEMYDFESGNI